MDSMSEEDANVVRRIATAETTLREAVWRGLEKRTPLGALDARKLSIVARAINRATQPRKGDAVLPPKEKEAIANRLEWAAKELASAWKAVSSIEGGLPFQLQFVLDEAVGNSLRAHEPTSTRALDDANDTLRDERALLLSAFARIDDIAECVASGAAFWRTYKTPLSKPNHPNADRLWFARVLTESFQYHFGAVMREEVAALTRIWFEDSTLTANSLSEVAKVRDSEAVRWPPRLSRKRLPRN